VIEHPAILTFDLEDWFQIHRKRFGFHTDPDQNRRFLVQARRILDLLTQAQARATFFILGMTAEAYPDVIAEIAQAGHKIGSHGYGHDRVKNLSPATFAQDLSRSVAVIESITGQRPRGFRAPEFSIDAPSFWAFDVLLDQGFVYDSSIFPFRGPRYGIPNFRLDFGELRTPSGRTILELPMTVFDIGPLRIPIAGGGYWRVLPGPVLDRALSAVARRRPPVIYLHPAEFDPDYVLARPLTIDLGQFVLRQNFLRRTIPGKLQRVLASHRCLSVEDWLEERAAS
jgi:polysaccharide deacetylase family protein (PEP-CTERM system associated)